MKLNNKSGVRFDGSLWNNIHKCYNAPYSRSTNIDSIEESILEIDKISKKIESISSGLPILLNRYELMLRHIKIEVLKVKAVHEEYKKLKEKVL